MKTTGLVSLVIIAIVSASAPQHSAANDEKPTVPKVKYYVGAGVGTGVGFGIGHAIQGRYMSKGLIFSLTEGISLLGYTVTAVSSLSSGISSGNVASANYTLPLIFLGVYLGFHIWEIVDVWTGVRPESSAAKASFDAPAPASRVSLFVAPAAVGQSVAPSLGVGVHF